MKKIKFREDVEMAESLTNDDLKLINANVKKLREELFAMNANEIFWNYILSVKKRPQTMDIILYYKDLLTDLYNMTFHLEKYEEFEYCFIYQQAIDRLMIVLNDISCAKFEVNIMFELDQTKEIVKKKIWK
jgi:hypothetical protein